jgi:PA14 domain
MTRFCLLAAMLACAALCAQKNDEPTFGTTVVAAGDLRGTVYFIPKDTKVLPDFNSDRVHRVGEIWTQMLNVPPRHWRVGFPGLTDRFEWFAIDYTGRFWISKPGRYTFALLSDDGSRLFIDNTPVIDDDCQHAPDLRIAAVKLDGGGHQIRVSYFQGPRDCLALILAVAGPDRQWRVFDTRDFKPPTDPSAWHYSETNSATIVPVTPQEASLSIRELMRRLIAADPRRDREALRERLRVAGDPHVPLSDSRRAQEYG